VLPAPLDEVSRIVQVIITAAWNRSETPAAGREGERERESGGGRATAEADALLRVLGEFLSLDSRSLSHNVAGRRRSLVAKLEVTVVTYLEDVARLEEQMRSSASAERLHRLYDFYDLPRLHVERLHATCGQGYERAGSSALSSGMTLAS
jgi:hypothetical protein